ncbi:MAG TPA: hypothetical protein VF676_03865 [Flavobacterium sp.]|jgi:hypothetical protein
MHHHRYTDEEYQRIFLFSDTNENDPRGIDNPGLNQDDDLNSKDEDFEESDDFHKYDDVDKANVDIDDEISRSNENLNANSENERPTFIRTYDKNATNIVDDIGKYDGNINI